MGERLRIKVIGTHVEDLGVLIILGAIFNSVLLMVAIPHAVQTTNFMLVQVGSAMVFRSRLRFILIQILNLVGWIALFLRVDDASKPDPWIFAIVSAVILSVALHLFIHRTIQHMEALFVANGIVVRQRGRLVDELRESLASVKTLRGFIPICAHCKKVRDDEGYWHAVEKYVKERSEAEFSHGICPHCAEAVKQEWERDRGSRGGR